MPLNSWLCILHPQHFCALVAQFNRLLQFAGYVKYAGFTMEILNHHKMRNALKSCLSAARNEQIKLDLNACCTASTPPRAATTPTTASHRQPQSINKQLRAVIALSDCIFVSYQLCTFRSTALTTHKQTNTQANRCTKFNPVAL